MCLKSIQSCGTICLSSLNKKALGLQELQKGIVKASQPIIELFHSALKARKDKSSMDSNVLLPLLADAVTFLRHAPFLTSLKRREFLKPDIISLINLFLTPLQRVCLGMNCPSILRRSERSVRFLGRCLAIRLRSRTWSVLTREGLINLAGATHRGLVESPLF